MHDTSNGIVNIVYDRSLQQYQALDDNFNLLNLSMQREDTLYNILHRIVDEDLIDQSLADEYTPEIYLFLVEKIHLSENKDNHKMQLFQGSLNYKTKNNLTIAYNKYMVNYMSKKTGKKVVLGYE